MGYCDSMIYDGDTLEREVSIKRVSRQDTDGKTNSPFQLGYVLMVDEQTRMGVLEGHLKWKGDSLGYPIDKIRISSRSNPSFWIREAVDTTGYYATQLP